ncbi:alpha/beta hydrolase [Methylophaga sp.]|uniref:alpha/beta hydrolase n=1 Tax=Methylophaga sp. TaxID=2024840 RepID=UPI0027159C75|nr:alpha/beta hydrolase [Methylophaga sp.]MDO8828267.1 alpha/beta hydrolase [Methylophaga sp.]
MKKFMLLFFISFAVHANDSTSWNRIILSGGSHVMIGFVPPDLLQADTLNIFIEGDGEPGVALKLAQESGGNSVYIGRPCQYLKATRFNSCNRELWTSHRYSQAVVDSMDLAISEIKQRYNAQNIRLVGYSGGGAIASIIASKRGDVALLVTVAGNLDHRWWTDFNSSDPLYGSLNPVDFSAALEAVPQVHLIGDHDFVVPGSVLMSYLSKFKSREKVKSYLVGGADHTCCWSMAVAAVLPQ